MTCGRARPVLSVVLAAALGVGCASAPSSQQPAPSGAGQRPPGVTGELILTRQRDLLDRGLINARVDNQSGSSFLLEDIRLDADAFQAESRGGRPVSVRRGRRVAIQVPYGDVDDCEVDTTVTARLRFRYTSDGDGTPREGVVELEGTDLLDGIRAEVCIGRRLADATATTFLDPNVVDGRLVTDLLIEPTGDALDISIRGAEGTILVAAHVPEGWTGVDVADQAVRIPLEFVVNRCDPHALAEVTKRFGLDLVVAADGGDPVEVPVDVSSLVDHLEAIVEQCRRAAGDG